MHVEYIFLQEVLLELFSKRAQCRASDFDFRANVQKEGPPSDN